MYTSLFQKTLNTLKVYTVFIPLSNSPQIITNIFDVKNLTTIKKPICLEYNQYFYVSHMGIDKSIVNKNALASMILNKDLFGDIIIGPLKVNKEDLNKDEEILNFFIKN